MSDMATPGPAGRFPTAIERSSEREITVRRVFDAPAAIVFAAWTKPDLLMRWWAPRSIGITLIGCQVDARTGGSYRFEFDVGEGRTMAFFGRYLEVIENRRLVWTNEEGGDGAVTTVTFEEKDGRTHLVLTDLYPSREALEAMGGAEEGMAEQFAQLDDVLVALA